LGVGIGVGPVLDDGMHCEYHSFVSTHSVPSTQHVAPFQVVPPHCPQTGEHDTAVCVRCLRKARAQVLNATSKAKQRKITTIAS
jgi:hypothetical protein